ncbi:MAG: hypothetical protein JXX14_06150, partial [Deltaproteobacteria bacterium]|nr:hypothetical protein [Deltaproteobacteria bacterium]
DTSDDVLAAADLSADLPDAPLRVTRLWINDGGRLGLEFTLENNSQSVIEVGALGLPMIFNNIISNRSLDDAHETCSFSDPYIGKDAGYIQVTRLNGSNPAMLVLPKDGTPLEAYNPILNPPDPDGRNNLDPPAVFYDNTPRNLTFEGFYEWMVHSLAYAENEWKGKTTWNEPTSRVLQPGESTTVGLTFVLSDEIRAIENTLKENRRPVAVAIPGTILPDDMEGKLYLDYPHAVRNINVSPSGALTVTESDTISGWKAYDIRGQIRGQARLTVTYANGAVQTIHYNLIKAAADAVADMGEFLTTRAWYEDSSDYFHRSPSVMTYDMDDNEILTQWKQAWVCGLGDDGGAVWLAGIMKLLGQPTPAQVNKYEQFVDGPIWGNLQYDSGDLMYGVKRTLFYYEPSELPAGYYDSTIDWFYWGAWSRAHIEEVPRSYNYPHVAALYWTLYRLARNYDGLVSAHTWDWYLNQAFETSLAMTTIGNGYAQFGVMNGSAFLEILKDLQREGLTADASALESAMKARADLWNTQAYPFGSEMPWDSTGQEEVYQWTKYFGYDNKADVCLNAILGYMPTVPHWGYNGCARRYWDFKYGGSKIDRQERMLHHYGSSLNAIPVLSEYREHPEDMYLLRIGYGGMMGTLANIQQNGFPSMAFHSFPDIMDFDSRTGDFGLNFFGHAYTTATYMVDHPDFGPQSFGGNLTKNGNVIVMEPMDSFRQRIYLAPVGLWLTLDAGKFDAVSLNFETGEVEITFAAQDANTPNARLRVEQPATIDGIGDYSLKGYAMERNAYVIPLSPAQTIVSF